MKIIEILAGAILIFVVVMVEASLTSIGGLGMIVTIIVLSAIGIVGRILQGRRQIRKAS